MSGKIPLLIIIPHPGLIVPEEFYGYEDISPDNIFFESDVGADTLYSAEDYTESLISSDISRLFVDMDREFRMLHPATEDGVIKSKTSMNKNIFREGCYPDEIAISNILKRYYFPFHERLRNSIKTGKIKLILECHTHMPVGPGNSPDRGHPRPLVMTGYTANSVTGMDKTAPPEMAMDLASIMGRIFSGEGDTVAGDFKVSGSSSGYLMRNYGTHGINMLYLSLSRSLFLNDSFFDLENLTIDAARMKKLREMFISGLEKFRTKYF